MANYPTYHFVEVSTDADTSARSADAENAGRPAVVEVTQQSSGIGQHRLPHLIEFPVVFRDEPHFTYGSAVIKGTGTGGFHDPRGSSGVYLWKRTSRGYYTGAFMWVRVDIDPIDIDSGDTAAEIKYAQGVLKLPKVQVLHYFTFSAVAMKAVNGKLTGPLNPRQIKL